MYFQLPISLRLSERLLFYPQTTSLIFMPLTFDDLSLLVYLTGLDDVAGAGATTTTHGKHTNTRAHDSDSRRVRACLRTRCMYFAHTSARTRSAAWHCLCARTHTDMRTDVRGIAPLAACHVCGISQQGALARLRAHHRRAHTNALAPRHSYNQRSLL